MIAGVECRVLPYSLMYAKMQSKNRDSSPAPNVSLDTKAGIFVKGFLKAQWLHSDIHRAFEKFGKILSAKVSIDRNHKGKGYGYVQYETPDQAQKAIDEVSQLSL
jgi:RNA recognition motif. (a.k.a. RRM, RBD, or RNP domain)